MTTNKPHFTEADLLETYYMQPGESMPVMMHLATCSDCASRYERLERKLREAASCSAHRHPETFWTRQRLAIMKTIERRQERLRTASRTSRVAAAASLAFFLGGALVYKIVEPGLKVVPPIVTAAAPTATVAPPPDEEPQLEQDPWQSEELREFRSVVEWESWVAEMKTGEKL